MTVWLWFCRVYVWQYPGQHCWTCSNKPTQIQKLYLGFLLVALLGTCWARLLAACCLTVSITTYCSCLVFYLRLSAQLQRRGVLLCKFLCSSLPSKESLWASWIQVCLSPSYILLKKIWWIMAVYILVIFHFFSYWLECYLQSGSLWFPVNVFTANRSEYT